MSEACSAYFPAPAAPDQQAPAAVTGSVRTILRAEALLELVAAVAAYHHLGADWRLFAVLFLLPDLSMVGYLANPALGARLYNVAHSSITPALLALCGFELGTDQFCPIALIWTAHIGFDRLLGYGLKYPTAFARTHLGWGSG